MRPCFTFRAATATQPAILALDDEIGFWGTQAVDFRNALNAVASPKLRVEINSPGGEVMAGLGMYNMLRDWASVDGRELTTRVTGLAGSIASIIMLAADVREMPSNSFGMIHSVQSGVWGTADEMRDHADTVDKIQASMRSIYIDRMGIDEAQATALMAKDNWLTADECLANGFVTAIVDPVQATAKFDLKRADLPENVAKVFAAATRGYRVHLTATNKVIAVASAEAANDLASAAGEDAAKVLKPEDEDPAPVKELTEDEKKALEQPVAESILAHAASVGLEAHGQFFALTCDSLDTAKARMGVAREITALCKVAKMEAKAAEHIRAGKTVAQVRAALVEGLANEDVHTDSAPRNHTTTNGNPAKPAVVNTESLWASHNKQSKGR